MFDIWASSPKDAYVVGHSDIGKGTMYRYDGNVWRPVLLHISEGGLIEGGFDLNSIWGFSSNDIWSVGEKSTNNDSGMVIHFDGASWKEVPAPGTYWLLTIWGANSNDLWVGGYGGMLFHYIGGYWTHYPDTT